MALAALVAVGGLVEFLLHHYDPTRVVYRRLKAPDRYLFEEIHPRFLLVDPGGLIGIRSIDAAASTRTRVKDVIWGRFGYPDERMPRAVLPGAISPAERRLPAVARIDKVEIEIGDGLHNVAYLLHAAKPSNRLVLYHHGFAGEIWAIADHLNAMAERGFDVLAFNLIGYGENSRAVVLGGGERVDLHLDMSRLDTPLRYHFEAPIVALNYALDKRRYRSADIIGFSAGGFMALATAALDPRLRLTFTVAGAYPLYLQSGQDVRPTSPQNFAPLVAAAAELDLFVLAAAGPGRGLTQIFNRYDRCCFNNRKGTLYAGAVADAVGALGQGGRFAGWIDESHADHKISASMMQRIIALIESPAAGSN